MTTEEKFAALLDNLSTLDGLAVAFSGGVDSSFLLKAAQIALDDRVVAMTIRSVFIPQREAEEAESFCRENEIRHLVLPADVLNIPGVRDNPPDRCYLCKRGIFEQIIFKAHELDLPFVAEGSNLDDEGDYRPGMRAIRELGVVSPLRQARLTKQEIRNLSRQLGLPSWDKPSMACLASRFVYGEALSEEALQRVEQAEDLLLCAGFRQIRVRIHGDLARIELPHPDLNRLLEDPLRLQIHEGLRALGFRYVTLDLLGYRTGSMNEALETETK